MGRTDIEKSKLELIDELNCIRLQVSELQRNTLSNELRSGEKREFGKIFRIEGPRDGKDHISVSGINIKWETKDGKCMFENLPVAMMWIDTTLKGLMSGVQSMVGSERFLLALESEGRKSVEEDWQVISQFKNFKQGFDAIANMATVAGWGKWEINTLDVEQKRCCFRVRNSWEGRYQKSLGVCWGSGMVAGKLSGYCSRLFGVNCWATQSAYLAKGEPYDEFWVEPSERSIENEIENLLATDEATRADMAVALQKLKKEVADRTRAEKRLNSTLVKLDATLNALPDLLFEVDRQGRLLDYRAQGSSLLYAPPVDFLGKTIEEILPEPVADICRKAVEETFGTGRSSGSIYSLQMSGSEHWYELSASISGGLESSDSHVIILTRDITDRKLAEDMLLMQRDLGVSIGAANTLDETLKACLDTAIKVADMDTGGIYLFDEQSQNLNLRYHKNLPDGFLDPNSFEKVVPLRKALIQARKPVYANYAQLVSSIDEGIPDHGLRASAILPVLHQGKPVGCLCLGSYKMKDVPVPSKSALEAISSQVGNAIARLKAVKELKASQKDLQELFNSINDFIFVLDSRGYIVQANDLALKRLGYQILELVGKSMVEIHPSGFTDRAKEVVVEILNNRSITYEIPLLARDCSWIPVETKVTKGNWGSRDVFFAVSRDITEREQIEKERLRSSKLESVGVLAGGIAHDFNNILAGVLGNISVAKLNLDKKDKVYAVLNDAAKACDRATSLTKQLLTFSKGGEPVKEIAMISSLVKDAVRFALRGSNVRCEFDIQDEIWAAEVDVGQINQVINNIIINADQAMPDGGVINICMSNLVLHSNSIVTLSVGRYVKIVITDEGIGIPEKYLSKIFDPFFTTKERGSGLGLATTFSIVQKHSGLITVESELGKGSTFFIYLPALDIQIQNASLAPQEDPFGFNGKKILVMDDEEIVLDIMEKFLEELDCQVVTSKNGTQAIAVFQEAVQSGQPFDAVILDLTVPGDAGGMETLKRLIQIDPTTKAVVSSGYSKDPIMSNYKDYGFSGVLAKPFSFDDMREQFIKLFEK